MSVLRIAYVQVSTDLLSEVLGLSAGGELEQFIAAQSGWKVHQETGLVALPPSAASPATTAAPAADASVTTTEISSSGQQRTKRHHELDKKKMASILATLSK